MGIDKPVTVDGHPGTLSHFVIKGPKKTYGIVALEDGPIEEAYRKNVKFK